MGGLAPGGDDILGGELVYLSQVFMDTRFLEEPLPVDSANPNSLAAGTVNLYIDVPLWDMNEVDVSSLLGIVQGTCTRTDPNFDNDAYIGHGVCDFTFELLDGSVVIASFTTSGPVFNEATAVMPITGGIGELAGMTGEVFLTLPHSFQDLVAKLPKWRRI